MCWRHHVLSLPTHLPRFSFPEFLRVRSHDPEEAIRHDVIVSIVTAAKKDLSLVNDALLNFVKERTLDKRVSCFLRLDFGLHVLIVYQCVVCRPGQYVNKSL